jgi:Putative threonine efflux protein
LEFQYIFKGIVVGLMASIPLGPIGVLIIQKTLQKGRLAGFISGSGAAVADTLFASIAVLGLGFVINFIQAQEFYFRLIGSIFLILVGLRIFLANTVKQFKKSQSPGKRGMFGDFLAIFFLTLSNPIAVLFFGAMFAGASVFGDAHSAMTGLYLLLGVLLGGALWWYALSTIVDLFRKKFRLKQMFWINKISGLIIAVLGFLVFLSCFEPIKSFLNS